MKLFVFCLAAGLIATTYAAGQCGPYDIVNDARDSECPNEFINHVSCVMPQVEQAVENIVDGSTGRANQNTVNSCFSRYGCDRTTFDATAALDTILPCSCTSESLQKKNCAFRYAADQVIDLLKSIPKPVGKCMTEYFKEIGQKMVQDCARDPKYNPVTPNFTQSAIPGLDNLDIDELGDVIVFQVMMRYNLLKCKSCNGQSSNTADIAQCLSGTVIPSRNVCENKQSCIDDSFPSGGRCLNRYDQVTKSVCSCVAATFAKYKDFGNIDINDPETKKQINELKKIFGNDMKKRLQNCYESTYDGQCFAAEWSVRGGMKDKYRSTMGAVIKAILKLMKGEVSDQLLDMLYVAQSVITELTSKWGDALCGECQEKDERKLTQVALEAMVSAKSGKSCSSVVAQSEGGCGENTGRLQVEASAFTDWFGQGK